MSSLKERRRGGQRRPRPRPAHTGSSRHPTRPPEPVNLAEHRLRRKQALGGLTHAYYVAALPPRAPAETLVTTRIVFPSPTWSQVTDRTLIFGQRHLRSVLAGYARHYNGRRPHRSRQLHGFECQIPQVTRRAICTRPGPTIPSPTSRGSGSSSDPDAAASSTNTSGLRKSPGQRWWPSSGTSHAPGGLRPRSTLLYAYARSRQSSTRSCTDVRSRWRPQLAGSALGRLVSA